MGPRLADHWRWSKAVFGTDSIEDTFSSGKKKETLFRKHSFDWFRFAFSCLAYVHTHTHGKLMKIRHCFWIVVEQRWGSSLLWGCFAASGRGCLESVQGTKKYQDYQGALPTIWKPALSRRSLVPNTNVGEPQDWLRTQHSTALKWTMGSDVNPTERLMKEPKHAPLNPETTGALCSRGVGQHTCGQVQKSRVPPKP